MKRKYKNLGIILLIFILIGLVVITQNKAKEYIKNDQRQEDRLPLEKPNEMEHDPETNPEDKRPENIPEPPEEKQPIEKEKNQIPFRYKLFLTLESLEIILLITYLIFSKLNTKSWAQTFLNKDRIYLFICICFIGTFILMEFLFQITLYRKPNKEMLKDQKENVELDISTELHTSNIDLTNYKSDITIMGKGKYTFSGEFNHAIIVRAPLEDDIELVLKNAKIENQRTATIIGLTAKHITITIEEDNELKDGGNSNYDGCIYSEVPLTFQGTGTLRVVGNQKEGEGIATESKDMTFKSGTYYISSNDDGINAGGEGGTITIDGGTFYINANGNGIDSNKNAIINGGSIFVIGSDKGTDAGIDTDEGYEINGGIVVALGNDMIEIPNKSSKQNVLAFTLDKNITKDIMVTLKKKDNVMISFKAPKSFKTIILSTPSIKTGEYTLWQGGTHTGTLENGIYKEGVYQPGTKIMIENQEVFSVSQNINFFGKE